MKQRQVSFPNNRFNFGAAQERNASLGDTAICEAVVYKMRELRYLKFFRPPLPVTLSDLLYYYYSYYYSYY
jgi:hypothetical protein